MKIGIFTNNYLPNPYGVTGSVESFRQEFEKLGHEVYIFAPRYAEYADTNPSVFRYPSLDINVKFRFPVPIPWSGKMDRIIDGLELDIIHVQHPNLLGAAGLRWARRKSIPVVFTWHTLYDRYAHFAKVIPEKLAAKWLIRQAASFANRCDQVIVPTESIKAIIRGWGVSNPNVAAVPTGIDERLFEKSNRFRIRQALKIKENDLVLLLVSRLTQEKNVMFVMQAVAPLIQENVKIKFIVVGGGDHLDSMRRVTHEYQIEDQVFFAGEVPRAEVKDYYAAADMFVYGSTSETQGMIITEAMYAGLLIVAVAATGVSDQVTSGVNGTLVPEDVNEFRWAVERLISHPDLRAKYQREAKFRSQQHIAPVCAAKMLAIYAGLMQRNSDRKMSGQL